MVLVPLSLQSLLVVIVPKRVIVCEYEYDNNNEFLVGRPLYVTQIIKIYLCKSPGIDDDDDDYIGEYFALFFGGK